MFTHAKQLSRIQAPKEHFDHLGQSSTKTTWKFEQQKSSRSYLCYLCFLFPLRGPVSLFFAPKSSRDFSSDRERWSQHASISMVKPSSHRRYGGSIPMYSGFLDMEPIWKDPLEHWLSGHDSEQNWKSATLMTGISNIAFCGTMVFANDFFRLRTSGLMG